MINVENYFGEELKKYISKFYINFSLKILMSSSIIIIRVIDEH